MTPATLSLFKCKWIRIMYQPVVVFDRIGKSYENFEIHEHWLQKSCLISGYLHHKMLWNLMAGDHAIFHFGTLSEQRRRSNYEAVTQRRKGELCWIWFQNEIGMESQQCPLGNEDTAVMEIWCLSALFNFNQFIIRVIHISSHCFQQKCKLYGDLGSNCLKSPRKVP